LCCQLCNQRFKRNLFPLSNPSTRAVAHFQDLRDEDPLFIDPAATDPISILEFRGHLLHAIEDNPRGVATIEALGLNREELAEARRDHLAPLILLRQYRDREASKIDADPPSLDLLAFLVQIDAQLEKSVQDSAQYAAMCRAALR
jgi:hypothetical protein